MFVFAVTPLLRGHLLEYPRLYAFPAEPERTHADGERLILDSGAFGLFKRGGRMDAAYMESLHAHYTRFGADNQWPVVGIAPDVYLSPRETVRNWHRWHAAGRAPVAPVIQFPAERRIDLKSVYWQAQVYRGVPWIAVSNPSARGLEALRSEMPTAIQMLREITGAQWVHILGAGWDIDDLRAWARMPGVDSADSIAYAINDMAWDGQRLPPRERALRNAQLIIQMGTTYDSAHA